MKNKKFSYMKISSLFTRSVLILFTILILLNMLLIAQIFQTNSKLNIDEYSNIINNSIHYKDDSLFLSNEGKELLLNHNLWIQIVDPSLTEVFSFNKPLDVPFSYKPIEFIHAYKYDIADSSLFVFEKELNEKKYSYFLGFPLEVITKYNVQYNPTIVTSLLNGNIITILFLNLFIIFIYSFFYFSKKIAKPVQKIMESIILISKGKYHPNAQKKSLYKEIFDCLDELAVKLERNKLEKQLLDQHREKWISYISHDMKTPLSSIKGFTELMKDKDYCFTESEIRQYSSIIYEKAVYMEEFIKDLNIIHKLKKSVIPLTIKPINLVLLIQQLIEEVLLIPKFSDKKIRYTNNSDVIYINGDAKLLKRALLNFIINSLLYSNMNPEVFIKVSVVGKNVEISIIDNGRGISSEELPFIFEQYYRGTNTNENSEGSGLGMAIAYEIIKLHKGECKIDSQMDVGTHLKIYLPITTNNF